MENLRKTLYTLLSIVAVIAALGSLLSIFRNTESRYLKMLDFPRIQFFLVSLISLVLFVVVTRKWKGYDYLLTVGLVLGLVVNGSYLVNYTPLVSTAVPEAAPPTPGEDRLGLLLANVKMSNKQAEPLLTLIRERQPDMILAMETDEWWEEQLEPIENTYPYSQETVNEVAYGMTLYSKYPLGEVEVQYLQNEKVPSFESTLTLPSGQNVSFHAVHPVPPTHFKQLPDNAGQREVAMQKIGNRVAERNQPAIVAGDINDVVWSYTDALTGTEDVLHDVRVGRGFYNSFNARNWLLRWPLDHVFVTREFRVRELERLPKIGSDHFPIYVELVL